MGLVIPSPPFQQFVFCRRDNRNLCWKCQVGMKVWKLYFLNLNAKLNAKFLFVDYLELAGNSSNGAFGQRTTLPLQTNLSLSWSGCVSKSKESGISLAIEKGRFGKRKSDFFMFVKYHKDYWIKCLIASVLANPFFAKVSFWERNAILKHHILQLFTKLITQIFIYLSIVKTNTFRKLPNSVLINLLNNWIKKIWYIKFTSFDLNMLLLYIYIFQ